MFTLLSVSLWSVFLSGCYAKLYTSVSSLPSLSYDFVVVGGGTAGSVVANRLTENPDFSVLVLEAGVSNAGVFDSEVPFLFADMLTNPLWSWNFSMTPQPGLGGRAGPYPRGRILGGCSSHNGMFYTRGSAEDYNRYAAVTGDDGWSWNNLLPYFFKNEKWTAPADGHDTRGQFDPAVHSTTGLTLVSLTGFSYPASARVLQTTKELPDEFPFNLDMNSGTPLGVGWLQETIGGGERSSAATSYLPPDIQQRPNLDILLNAQVTRLLANTSSDGVSFHSVEFSQDQNAPRLTVTARKEIILSAGAVGTPSILQHSGVGNKTALTALGLQVLLDLPGVGQNAADHPAVFLTWAVSGNETLEAVQQNATRLAEAEAEWNATRTGPFTAIGVSHVGYTRVASVYAPGEDPAAGPATPHIELTFTEGSLAGLMPGGHFFTIAAEVASPVSRGSVTINSTDPFAPPLIDPGLLANVTDLHALREGAKMAQRFVTAPVWAGYILSPANALASATDDDAALEAAIIAAAGSGPHLVGTASMSARGSTNGVVDPDLLVKGARGLRIIDASVLPFIPAAHTQVPTYVIAERAADLVKAAWA
ncbi:pyranose dehydrogenase [Mycena galericulata]|nr:pyranose dehydrogenase [Mycena galericulata]